MKFRPVDEYGDMLPMRIPSQLLEDTDAVAAAVESRMKLGYGEWWEDETLGFQVPTFLIEGVRGDEKSRMLVNYMIAYMVKTKGVTSVNYYNWKREKRKLTVNVNLATEFGGEVEGSVDLNELLGS